MARSSNYPLTDLTIYRFNITWVLRFAPWSFAEERKHWDAALRGCDFFVSCDSVVPLKRDSNHLSSLPGIPLPLHAGLFSFVPVGTWLSRQHEIVSRLSIVVASRWIEPSASQAQRQNDRRERNVWMKQQSCNCKKSQRLRMTAHGYCRM